MQLYNKHLWQKRALFKFYWNATVAITHWRLPIFVVKVMFDSLTATYLPRKIIPEIL